MIIPVAGTTWMIILICRMIIVIVKSSQPFLPRVAGSFFVLAGGPSHRDGTRMFLGQSLLLGRCWDDCVVQRQPVNSWAHAPTRVRGIEDDSGSA